LDHRIDLRADRRKYRQQITVAGYRPTELLDHVHGSADLFSVSKRSMTAPSS
jgi:hypothetical protein